MRFATLTILALATTLAACAKHAPVSPPRPLAGTPEDCDRLFGERLNAGDLDGLVALYEPNATLVRDDGSQATGTEAIRAELAKLLEMHPHITMNVLRVRKGGGDIAVLDDDWHATGKLNGKKVDVAGHASEVVRRQKDGTWRFVIDDPDARGPRVDLTKRAPAKGARRRK